MTTEWHELKTLQEVAAAQAAGEEIEYIADAGNYKYEKFKPWDGKGWHTTYEFRSRPKQPKMKKIVLREALLYLPTEMPNVCEIREVEIAWLDTPAREIEVPE